MDKVDFFDLVQFAANIVNCYIYFFFACLHNSKPFEDIIFRLNKEMKIRIPHHLFINHSADFYTSLIVHSNLIHPFQDYQFKLQ